VAARKKVVAAQGVTSSFTFFQLLWEFYNENRKRVRREYTAITKTFLDFNDPGKPDSNHSISATAFLRMPQFEALEMYVFLKEFLGNAEVHKIFKAWREKSGAFENRTERELFEETNPVYDAVFEQMRRHIRTYPNYIFALTMGTGKTILMATCIFYEFLVSNKYPKDERFCHNALVFAPDKTVLESLREIQTFDLSKVVPPQYVNFLNTHLKFHFLDETGMSLNIIDGSKFNIIISNTQKIILKRQHKEKTATDKLFGAGKATYKPGSVYESLEDLYDLDSPDDTDSLSTNQRFQKLARLQQLGIYIDEAHHAFGKELAKDMGTSQTDSKTSLRNTVDLLAKELETAGTGVVACYNYTGTPYVGNDVLPEVVYAYSLNDAIKNRYLKNVRTESYSNTRTEEFVQFAINDFLERTGVVARLEDCKRFEGMLPKLAFFASSIEELNRDLRPAVEAALGAHGISSNRILVNVGDEKMTSNDDIREFNRLDTPGSEKQFILLVNKGREGWNCRSLFGVGLYREPKSKVFVLQATMRCLRAITNDQQTGNVYLSAENKQILDDELQQNFRISLAEIEHQPDEKQSYEIRLIPPPVKVKLVRQKRLYTQTDKKLVPGVSLEFEKAETDKYRLERITELGLPVGNRFNSKNRTDITYLRTKIEYSEIMLVAEISRYLNRSCLEIETVLSSTKEGVAGILAAINEFNELLYDWVIPRLFGLLYDIKTFNQQEEYEIELVKAPVEGHYNVRGKPALTTLYKDMLDSDAARAAKSFHLDTYCFDSNPEQALFWALLADQRVQQIYFTGMLTHGQSEFFVQYIDPDSRALRSYYPDFLVRLDDGTYVILEVKADNMVDSAITQAKKDYAAQMALVSGMRYEIVKATDASKGTYDSVWGTG
jgi:type III restriction enzyme